MATNSNYKSPIGGFAAPAYALRDHYDGYGFRHNSDQIDVNPPVSINGNSAITVASALSAISTYISQDVSAGQGFITIGDGYDTYHNSDTTPLTAYDAAIPALDTALNDLLNNSSNPLHHRIRSGGIVLIKAGTYKFVNTVNVPPGIVIIGEGYGTKIANQISSSTKNPLFNIKADLSRSTHDDIGDTNKFMFSKDTVFMNLVVSDNFIEPKFLGDLSYKTPQNTDGYGLITVEEGASFVCDNIKFIGKVSFSGPTPSITTGFAISTNSTVPSSTGTMVYAKNCVFDGFANPIRFTSSGTIADYLYCLNNKIRSYGSANNSYGSTKTANPIVLKPCNTTISNNYIVLQYINNNLSGAVPVLAYMFGPLPSSFSLSGQKLSGLISNNNIFATDNTGSIPSTLNLFTISTNPSQNTMDAVLNYAIYGNNDFNGGYSVAFNPSGGNPGNGAIAGYYQNSATAVFGDNALFLNGQTVFGPYALQTTTGSVSYIVSTTDVVIYAATASFALSISLPTASNVNLPRTLIIKDIDGAASTHNITLVRNSGGERIEGALADYVINTNLRAITLHTSGNGKWFIIS